MDLDLTEEHSATYEIVRSSRADLWQPISSLDKEFQ